MAEHRKRMLKAAASTAAIPMVDRCIDVGVSDWIRKPFRTSDLIAKIHRVLASAEETAHE